MPENRRQNFGLKESHCMWMALWLSKKTQKQKKWSHSVNVKFEMFPLIWAIIFYKFVLAFNQSHSLLVAQNCWWCTHTQKKRQNGDVTDTHTVSSCVSIIVDIWLLLCSTEFRFVNHQHLLDLISSTEAFFAHDTWIDSIWLNMDKSTKPGHTYHAIFVQWKTLGSLATKCRMNV